jgi:hypothetical protein
MAGLKGKQFVVVNVLKPADDADFFSRIYDAAAMVVNDKVRQVDTGQFVVRLVHAETERDVSANVHFEVSVDNVNQFAEDVWNRGVKYASRPQNYPDGLRRVSFVSPGNITVTGVGPLKLDSTGAFPSFRPTK